MKVSAQDFIEQGSGVVCLCGSTKFFFECTEANRQLTFNNWIVLQCGSWGHSFHKYTENTNKDYGLVKKLHFHKILHSDLIVVVSDATNYEGSSTKAEIQFARHYNKPVIYFDGENFFGIVDVPRIPNELADSSLIDNFSTINLGLGF